jgi:dipeptidyl aminopeptidase/acylaminoacyl peptidase
MIGTPNAVTARASHLVYCMVALLFVSASVPIRGQSKHRVTLDDLLTLKHSRYPIEISPSGTMLTYWLDGDIWLVATRPEAVPRKLVKGYLPVWSPDSTQLAYYCDGSGTFQLCVFDIQTSRSEQVTQLEGGIDPDPGTQLSGSRWSPLQYKWSPDGRELVFASQVVVGILGSQDMYGSKVLDSADKGKPLVLTSTTPPNWTLSGVFVSAFPQIFDQTFWQRKKGAHADDNEPLPETANQLFIVDIHSKSIRQLTNDKSVYSYPNWSHDGKTIVCISREGRPELPGITNVYVIDVVSGAKTPITTGTSSSRISPSWSPDGRYIAYLSREHYGQQRLLIVPSTGGRSIDVTSRLDRFTDEFLWSPDGKSVVVGYVDAPSYLSIARVDIVSKSIETLGEGGSAGRHFLTLARSGVLAWQQSDSTSAAVIRMLSPGGISSIVLIDFNPQVSGWALGEQEVVHWKNRRGDDMDGILIKPVGYRSGHRYPLIVDAYPIHTNAFHGEPMGANQAFASKGYAVFMPISRVPHFYWGFLKSEAYTQAAKGPKGWDVTLDDVMSGIDELIHRGIVDPERMGLYGMSNGGGTVNYLVTQTNRFKCAVSVASALSDWVRPSLMHTGRAAAYADLEGGALLWDDPYAYVQLSAVFRLNHVSTPMLLADGDKDGDCLLDEIEMYNGLRQLGQDVTLLRYREQGHGFTGLALKDFWERENAFFDKYLNPEMDAR